MTVKLYTFICRLHNDLRGQDLVEYALMAGFVAVAGELYAIRKTLA